MNVFQRFAALAVVAVIAVTAASCGGTTYRDAKVTGSGGSASTMPSTMTGMDSMATDTTATTTPTDTTASDASATTNANGTSIVTVDLAKTSTFSLAPSVNSVPAGKVTFNIKNDGTMVHEMVVVKTEKTPQQLAEPDGTANESTSVGEAADIAGGASKSVTLKLIPGHYILLCNLPGHYKGGMYDEFNVTAPVVKPVVPVTGVTDVAVALAANDQFSMQSSLKTVKAGKVRFIVTNFGTMTHEMVAVLTDKTPKQLTEPDGTANESTSVGEAADLEPGATKMVTLDLKAGHYILLCNLPGHYAGGMYQEFTVT